MAYAVVSAVYGRSDVDERANLNKAPPQRGERFVGPRPGSALARHRMPIDEERLQRGQPQDVRDIGTAELAVAPMVALMVALGLVQVGLGQGR